MKIITLTLLFLLIPLEFSSQIINLETKIKSNCKDIDFKYKPKLYDLVNAMIMVESSSNDSAYSKKENAVGCLQIRPIMLKECNRILKLQKSNKKYKLSDRWDRTKSIEIFYIVNNYHNKNASYEQIARFWNGGPKWNEKGSTKVYWNKVRLQLKRISEEYEKYSIDRLTEV